MPQETDELGRVPVEEGIFTPEIAPGGEEGAAPASESEEGAQPTGEVSEGAEGEEGFVDPEKGGEGTPAEEGRVYAGKYNSVEELKKGFVNLGGNPAKYDTPEKLEEAYEVRNAEWRRMENENRERARLESTVNLNPTPTSGDNPQAQVEALLDKVNWDKVGNARDLGRELITLLQQNRPEQKMPSEAEIVERVLPVLQHREAAQRELSALESEIPNLRVQEGETNEFRDAFATFVLGQKRGGDYKDLHTSMKNFLQWNQRMVAEFSRVKGIGMEAKLDAGSPTERGAGLPDGNADEADSIIGEYKKRQEKLGMVE